MFLIAVLLLVGCGDNANDADAPATTPRSTTATFNAVGDRLRVQHEVVRPRAAGDYFMPDSMGPGCGMLDVDGDGLDDLVLLGAVRGAGGELASADGNNRLLRQTAAGSFADVSDAAGIAHPGYGMGVAVGDIDNDGDLDLFVTNLGPDALFVNHGNGTFDDVTATHGLTGKSWGASAAFLDYDLDGRLDLFVTNYLTFDAAIDGRDAAGRSEYPSPAQFPGADDVLYRNVGSGRLQDVTAASGLAGHPGKGLGLVCVDLNGDALVDVYVANDGEPNFAWINDGAGTFHDQAFPMGLAVNAHGSAEAGMGVAAGDVEDDGDIDLFVTHLVQETNTLYVQDAPGVFSDATIRSGLAASSVDVTGFGTAFTDVDLDGDLDLLVANGRVLRGPPHPRAAVNAHWRPYAEPNQMFVNDGTGRYTDDAGCGDFCAEVEVSRGLVAGDVDRDGDPDVLVTNSNGTARLYNNLGTPTNGWLDVRLVDHRGVEVVGAMVTVDAGSTRRQRPISRGTSYLSSGDGAAHFGLGDARRVDAINVRWPDGTAETFAGGPVDRRLTLTRGNGSPALPPETR